MNDGLAFQFMLAVIAASQVGDASWVAEWLGIDLVCRMGIGIAIGWFFGRALAQVESQGVRSAGVETAACRRPHGVVCA